MFAVQYKAKGYYVTRFLVNGPSKKRGNNKS